MTIVTTDEARKNLAQLLELAFYRNEFIQIKRNQRPMGWIVGEPFMDALETLLKDNPGLADTLEILLDDNLRADLDRSIEEGRAGNAVPIKAAWD